MSCRVCIPATVVPPTVSSKASLLASLLEAEYSCSAGESLYTLDDGKTMKIKVIRLQEQIDAVRCEFKPLASSQENESPCSRKIQTYGVPAAGEEGGECIAPPQRQLLLQKNVRNYATTIVRGMCV